MRHILILGLGVCVLWSPPVWGKKGRGPGGDRPVVAIVLVSRGNPDAKISNGLLAELSRAAGPGIRVMGGRPLKKAAKSSDAVLSKCSASVACLAGVGRQVGAVEVIHGRLTPSGRGVKARITVIEVAAGKVARELTLELPTVAAIGPVVAERRDQLFGPPDEELPLDAVLGPTATASPGASSAAEPTGGSAADGALLASADSGAEPDPLADLDLAVIPMTEGEPELTDESAPPAAVEVTAAITPAGPGRLLLWSGIGVATVGAVGLGLGSYWGATYDKKWKALDRGYGGDSYSKGERIWDDADATRKRANLLLIGGGAVAACGLAMIAVDLFALDHPGEVVPQVTVGASGTGAWVRAVW